MNAIASRRTRLRVGMLIWVLAVISMVLALVSLIWPTWLEDVVGISPDGGSGETEWGIVAAFAAASVLLALVGRRLCATDGGPVVARPG